MSKNSALHCISIGLIIETAAASHETAARQVVYATDFSHERGRALGGAKWAA
jgi:hypothetical protein